MKPILALLLVATFLVGMCFLVVSTSQYMRERKPPPVVPSQYLTAAGGAALVMYGAPPDLELERHLQNRANRQGMRAHREWIAPWRDRSPFGEAGH